MADAKQRLGLMEPNSESPKQSNDEQPQGYVIEVKPATKDVGTFVHREGAEITLQLGMDDRPDLVRKFGTFMRYVASNHNAVKLGCMDCGEEIYASGDVPDMEHEFKEDDCLECGGRLINLDYEFD